MLASCPAPVPSTAHAISIRRCSVSTRASLVSRAQIPRVPWTCRTRVKARMVKIWLPRGRATKRSSRPAPPGGNEAGAVTNRTREPQKYWRVLEAQSQGPGPGTASAHEPFNKPIEPKSRRITVFLSSVKEGPSGLRPAQLANASPMTSGRSSRWLEPPRAKGSDRCAAVRPKTKRTQEAQKSRRIGVGGANARRTYGEGRIERAGLFPKTKRTQEAQKSGRIGVGGGGNPRADNGVAVNRDAALPGRLRVPDTFPLRHRFLRPVQRVPGLAIS
jgi:hypothetical protein